MESGSQLSHYEILALLGKGGMGEVWRAKDTKLGREVAIKTLPAPLAQALESSHTHSCFVAKSLHIRPYA